MDEKKKEAIMNCKTFDELLDVKYRKIGTPERDKFEDDAQAFILAECLKNERKRPVLPKSSLQNVLERRKAIFLK